MTSKDLISRSISTTSSWAPTALRIVLGAVIFAHGAQKAFGWFGGYGYEGTMGFLTGAIGLPAPLAFLVIFAEVAGGLALMAGLLSRVAALGVGAVMIGAVFTTHLDHGFFMNWAGSQQGEGFEYHLLVLAMTGSIAITGSGAASLDQLLARWLARDTGSIHHSQPALASR